MSVLEVQSLTKRYGRFVAVDDISFSVEQGAVFGLLGQNGSGKTTTIACALGLRRPSAGKTSVLGLPSREIHKTAGRVGVVFDAPILAKGLSVGAQLKYSMGLFGGDPKAGGDRVWRSAPEALALVGMDKLKKRSVTKLSLGQQKRLAVATALAGAPELLVLDEPLSGLDPLGARDLLTLFGTLAAEGLTIVISSHRLRDIEPALSHAAILVGGRVAAQGTIEQLLGTPGRHRIVVDQVARASEVLRSLSDVVVLPLEPGAEDSEAGALLVDAPDRAATDLSRILVEAGVGLSELRPADQNLATLFESLADRSSEASGVMR
ncbi:MAG: ABC-2 type transport system ATP-binding protein [Planctomycetota bacterium]|jgi:ABC-2 type transport system ATP-binding protein